MIFIISQPTCGLPLARSESVKRDGCILFERRNSRAACRKRRRGGVCSGFTMLNVATLWTAFVVNFLSLGLIWAFVMRSYPAFEAARFWTASAFAAAAGA